MFIHFSCVRTIHFLLIDINCVWYFFTSLSLSLSWLVYSWHLKRESILHPKTLFVPGHHLLPLLILPPLMSSSVIIKLVSTFQRTFLDGTFIRNAKSSFQISLILTYPLSSTVGVGSPFMTSWSLAPPWSYRSSNPTCTDLILLYLVFSLLFEVYV